MTSTIDQDDRRRWLRTYLRDHRAGADAGVRLASRIGAPSAEDAADVRTLAQEIRADRDRLDEIMAALDVTRSRWKAALAVVAETAGRLKTNGRIVRRSPLSAILELEALGAGVRAKHDLWATLVLIAPSTDGLDGAQAIQLRDRASDQLERIVRLHQAAVRQTFG